MSDSPQQPANAAVAAVATSAVPRWRDVWQAPVLAVSVAALVGAIAYSVAHTPKPDYGAELVLAEKEIEEGKYSEALATLNQRALPIVAKGLFNDEQRAEFHLLRARALVLGQEEAGISRAENHEAIIGEYAAAEGLHAELTARDIGFLAGAHLSLGDMEKADAAIARLPAEAGELRRTLLKRIVLAAAQQEHPDVHRGLEYLARLGAEKELTDAERIWVLRRQAEMLVAAGEIDDGVTRILRTLPRLEKADPVMLGEVLVTLGEAYLAGDQIEKAGEQLDRAIGLLGDGNELTPRALRLRAVADQRKGGDELARAREDFRRVADDPASGDEAGLALLGLAEVESVLGNNGSGGTMEVSAQCYERLTDLVLKQGDAPRRGVVTRQQVLGSVLARFAEQRDKGDRRMAMRLAELAGQLDTGKPTPAVLLALATANEDVAREVLSPSSGEGALSLAQLDPATQKEARALLLRAGEFYRKHAAVMAREDAAVYGQSLWNAADAFDRAGDLDASVAAFQQFQTDFPSDQRQPEAAFRLAEAYRARGDLELAEKLYRELIAGRSGASGPQLSGQFADSSYVPLAKTLLLDSKPENDKEAEGLLLSVVRGEVGGTAAPNFTEALRELGEHYYHSGQYERAIERLEELAGRAGESDVSSPGETYMLADSYRLSAAAIASALRSAMPDAQRVALDQTRRDRLERAARLYQTAIAAMEGQGHRTALDEVRVRNAAFYVGDCAYELRDFENAIRHYDAARDKYSKDPASLVAMVQIVACLVEQGKTAEAATANARARRFYDSLPESVWDDPTLPMTRTQWEAWLTAQARLAGTAEEKTGPE